MKNWNLRSRPAYPEEYERRWEPLSADGFEIIPSQKIMARRSKTPRKQRGGNTELQAVIDAVPVTANLLINPTSKFAVATYWWGRGNLNKNLQSPCPEDIMEPVKEQIEGEIAEYDPDFAEIYEEIGRLNELFRAGEMTPEDQENRKKALIARNQYLAPYFADSEIKARIAQKYAEAVAQMKSAGNFKDPRPFEAMIGEWEESCKKANCNYIVAEYPYFAQPGNYQKAINAKPLFIRKALDAAEGRGVLYIDGDMFVNSYPKIFDTANVDFMARGWNVDPRANAKYKKEVCFDPYIFETSGGTMYFGNTPDSRALLDAWAEASARPENAGKADDRILSMVVTERAFALTMNLIQLPIEYLWLTDLYTFHDPVDATKEGAIIEHPACLTGEERAADQGASSSRQPPGYERIEDAVQCAKRGGLFYEYIAFPNKESVDAFAPYLKYIKTSMPIERNKRMMDVVEYEDKYGIYNTLALKNKDAASLVNVTIPDGSLATLPLNAPIPDILAHLMKGHDVQLGTSLGIMPKTTEFAARNLESREDPFHLNIRIDTQSPMLISSKNPVIVHLLMMCKTLEDINIHLYESYVFLSRIRWNLGGQPKPTRQRTRRAPFLE